MARDPVELNFSKQRPQILFWVSDWVAVRTQDGDVRDGVEVDPGPANDTKFSFYVFLGRQANVQNNFLIFIIFQFSLKEVTH